MVRWSCPRGSVAAPSRRVRQPRRGFTLVEILVATALTLLMMGLVVTVFALVSDNISGSRSTLEMTDRLRSTADRMRRDLDGITAQLRPPRSPEFGEGYFEYIEGPIGPVAPPWVVSIDTDAPSSQPSGDFTAGDVDDLLMFTTRAADEPFVGRFGGNATAQSDVAEVCWFVRGNRLYRRQLLVLPGNEGRVPPPTAGPPAAPDNWDLTRTGFYGNYDVSVRQLGGDFDRTKRPGLPQLAFNSLSDLTKRENRYGHQPWAWPHDARFWGRLGLPTLRECSFFAGLEANTAQGVWPFPLQRSGNGAAADPPFVQGAGNVEPPGPWAVPSPAVNSLIVPLAASGTLSLNAQIAGPPVQPANQRLELTPGTQAFDLWRRPNPWPEVERLSGTLAAYSGDPNPNANPVLASIRTEEDVILENVISFDVKIWDPGAPIFQAATVNNQLTYLAPGDPGYIPGTNPGDPSDAGAVGLIPYILHVQAVAGGTAPVVGKLPVGFGAFVDLNYMCLAEVGGNRLDVDYPIRSTANNTSANVNSVLPPTNPQFHGPADLWEAPTPALVGVYGDGLNAKATDFDRRSRMYGTAPFAIADWTNPVYPAPAEWFASVWDTNSNHYERDGINQDLDAVVDQGTDGFDNPGSGPGSDEASELEAPPPYSSPLSGLQIQIRVFDPNSRQIREVTIIKQFAQ